MRGHPVGDGISRHPSLIHLQKNNFLSFRRPEIIAAHVQFFRVNPVHFAVQDVVLFLLVRVLLFVFLFFIARERMFTLLASDGMNIKIVLAHVCEPLAIGRKLRIFARVRRRRKLHRRSRIQAVIPELSLRIEEQMLGIRRPRISGDVIPRHAFFLALVLDVAGRRRQL